MSTNTDSIRLGMPALIETPDIRQCVELCRRLRLDFVELNMNLPAFCPESLDPAVVRALSEESGVAFTLHLPEETDLASFHPCVRQAHLQRCLETLRWASEAGIALVNLHACPGVYFSLPERKVWIYGEHEGAFRTNLEASFAALLAEAGRHEIMLCVENTGHFHLPHMQRALERLCAMEGLCLTWDVGHDAATGFREHPILMEHCERIAHMHLHDCVGTSAHQVLGTGTVGLPVVLRFAIDRAIGVVIETKTADALEESVRVVRSLMDRLAGAPRSYASHQRGAPR